MSSDDVRKGEGVSPIEMVEHTPKSSDGGNSPVDQTAAEIDGSREDRVTAKAWLCVFVRNPHRIKGESSAMKCGQLTNLIAPLTDFRRPVLVKTCPNTNFLRSADQPITGLPRQPPPSHSSYWRGSATAPSRPGLYPASRQPRR